MQAAALTFLADPDGVVRTAATKVKEFLAAVTHRTDDKTPAVLHVKIAPASPDADYLKGSLDDNTKILVEYVNRLLELNLKDAKDFQDVQGIINAKGNLIAKKKNEYQNPAIYTYDSDIQVGQTPEIDIKAIHRWLSTEFITDPEVLEISGLNDDKTIKNFLTLTSTGPHSLLSWLLSMNIESKEVLDVGIFQYPSKSSPLIRLHRVKLAVWVKETTIAGGIAKRSEGGVRGEYYTYTYEPSVEGIAALNKEQQSKILKAFDEFSESLSK